MRPDDLLKGRRRHMTAHGYGRRGARGGWWNLYVQQSPFPVASLLRQPDGSWKASVNPPRRSENGGLEDESIKSFQAWEAANAPTSKGGFRSRTKAGEWAIRRSIRIGVLHELLLLNCSPLELLALESE